LELQDGELVALDRRPAVPAHADPALELPLLGRADRAEVRPLLLAVRAGLDDAVAEERHVALAVRDAAADLDPAAGREGAAAAAEPLAVAPLALDEQLVVGLRDPAHPHAVRVALERELGRRALEDGPVLLRAQLDDAAVRARGPEGRGLPAGVAPPVP